MAFITGDLGRIDDQSYLWIVGRAKDLIIAGGYNVYPAEVEAAIDAISDVFESAVIGIPDADLGERVMAIVKRKSGSNLMEADIIGDLSERLARFKQPRRIEFVDELPRNAMGRCKRRCCGRSTAAPFNPIRLLTATPGRHGKRDLARFCAPLEDYVG